MKITALLIDYKRYALYERGIRPRSYDSIRSTVVRLTRFAHSDNLQDYTSGAVRAFLHESQERFGWSPRTFRNHRQYLDSFFSWCTKCGYVQFNPVSSIGKPKVPQALPRYLTRNEVEKLLSQLALFPWGSEYESIRNETIIYTFLYSGVRLRELLGLRVMDVSLDEQQLFISMGKGQKDRVIPIHPTLAIRLRTYLEARRRKGNTSVWLFTGLHSEKQLWPKDIHRICMRISIVSKVKFTPHQLRHTLGRLSIDANLSPYKLKEILGHSDISTTMIYASVSNESLHESFRDLKLV